MDFARSKPIICVAHPFPHQIWQAPGPSLTYANKKFSPCYLRYTYQFRRGLSSLESELDCCLNALVASSELAKLLEGSAVYSP